MQMQWSIVGSRFGSSFHVEKKKKTYPFIWDSEEQLHQTNSNYNWNPTRRTQTNNQF